MHLRAAQQLFLTYLAIIAILTVTTSLGAERLLRQSLLDNLEEDLGRELALSRALYSSHASTLSPDSIAALISGLSGRRVTIIDANGGVAAETDSAAAAGLGLEVLSERPEIQEAIDAGQGRALGFSRATLRAEHLFMAAPTGTGEILRLAVPLGDVDRAVSATQRGIFGAAALATILAIVFSFGFSLSVTRPLRRIGDAARELARGDLSRRIRVQRDDELGELGAALNTLGDELQRRLGQLEGERAEMQALIDSMSEGVLALSSTGSLRRANPAARRMFALGPKPEGLSPEMVSRRPDFLRLVEMALDGQAAPPAELSAGGVSLLATGHPLPDGGAVLVFLDISELRRLEGVRRDFVANASHELKTPLTAIRGYSETLAEPNLPPDLVRRFAEIVRSNADRLQRIVDDLLDLSRIEGGGWRLDSSRVQLEPLAREVWGAVNSGGKEVALRMELGDGYDTVWADAGAVRQVLTNLFSNALRYTPSGGSVTLRSGPPEGRSGRQRRGQVRPSAFPGWTLLEVADTGTGIPAPHLSRIFERFYRADPARSREEGGTGLGLAIVKHLVESHGGWIEAESTVGAGTTIRFLLPSEPSRTADSAIPRETGS